MNDKVKYLIENEQIEDDYENYIELRIECRKRKIGVIGKNVQQLHSLLREEINRLKLIGQYNQSVDVKQPEMNVSDFLREIRNKKLKELDDEL